MSGLTKNLVAGYLFFSVWTPALWFAAEALRSPVSGTLSLMELAVGLGLSLLSLAAMLMLGGMREDENGGRG